MGYLGIWLMQHQIFYLDSSQKKPWHGSCSAAFLDSGEQASSTPIFCRRRRCRRMNQAPRDGASPAMGMQFHLELVNR
jgi:hypothetical protein